MKRNITFKRFLCPLRTTRMQASHMANNFVGYGNLDRANIYPFEIIYKVKLAWIS